MKWLAVTIVTVLALVGITATGVLFGLGYYLSPQDKLAKADAIVAISGGDTSARTEKAVELYQAGWAPHIIFSGAALDPNSPSNAEAMAAAARRAGVPDSAIQLDEAATNTRENAAGTAEIARQGDYHSIILVTSPYHQRRASLVFRRALGTDIHIINHSSVDQDWRRSHWWASQYSRSLTLSELQKVIYELASEAPAS